PKWQRVEGAYHAYVSHIKRAQTLVSPQVVRIGHEPGRIPGRGLIQGVAVIENLRESIDTAERQSMAEAPLDLRLKRMIRAVAGGEPSQGIPQGGIGPGGSGRNVNRARRSRSPRGRGALQEANGGGIVAPVGMLGS